MNIDGSTDLVTGANRGIGAVLASRAPAGASDRNRQALPVPGSEGSHSPGSRSFQYLPHRQRSRSPTGLPKPEPLTPFSRSSSGWLNLWQSRLTEVRTWQYLDQLHLRTTQCATWTGRNATRTRHR
jgi:hypothetical protein